MVAPRLEWRPTLREDSSPIYRAIADALALDIKSGVLAAGDRLPPQRALAEALAIDFTTVSRAYAEAGRRGLVEGRVGKGTYVRAGLAASQPGEASGVADMGMNMPPMFSDPLLEARLWTGIAGLETRGGMALIMRYQEAGGTLADRAAGALWLTDRLPGIGVDRLLVCSGAQGALLALLTILGPTAGSIAVEALTYPGFRSLAAHLAIPLVPVAMDAEGMIPDAFEELCRKSAPRLLYCTPTLHNPTTTTLSLKRRLAIIATARRHDMTIIEDDAYGKLSASSVPPLAALAPDIVYHVAGLSKCVSPALRIAYVAVPDARAAARLAGAIRATTAMASPLGAAIATHWIKTGLADEALTAIRDETEIRRAIAAGLLKKSGLVTSRNAFHAWMPLAPGWARNEFAARLRGVGIGVVPSDAFALEAPPEAVRLALGAISTRDRLTLGLQRIADMIAETPAMSSTVV